MSRCFPFPPPGYEREHRREDLALLKEVKHKEKKHKKEKKDKERRKDKEKKEKDGSGEKQKDKKDRKEKHKDKKEKHRDKKKDKEDRGKDKEKSSISEESTIAGKHEERSGEKLHPRGHSKDGSVADQAKSSTFCQGQNGGKPSQSILSFQAIKEAKFALELDRRVRDDEKCREGQFPERVASADKKDQGAAAGTALRNPARLPAEEKSNDGDNRVHIKKMETQRVGGEFTGKAMVENLTRVAKSKNEGTLRPVEEQNDWRLGNKEKHKETGHDKRGDKHKERDNKSHGKDKDKEKQKKKEKAKLKIENKKSEHEKSTIVRTNNLIIATSNKSANVLKDDSIAHTEENVGKRKDMDTNGFLHETDIRPNKIQRLAVHQSTENGRKVEASCISNKSSFDKHAVPNNAWLGHQDRLNNGTIEAQKPNSSSTNMVIDQNVVAPKTPHHDFSNANGAHTVPKVKDHTAEEATRRAPHPDSKYLSQVLTVPKMGDWSENDDEEWWFSKKGPPEKPKLELAGVNEELHVWSEAVHIEPADVYALPYVIPY